MITSDTDVDSVGDHDLNAVQPHQILIAQSVFEGSVECVGAMVDGSARNENRLT